MSAEPARSSYKATPAQPYARLPTISTSIAAQRAGKSQETIVQWCRDQGIGKQFGPKNPWRVDPLALEIRMAGDAEALAAYSAGDFTHRALPIYQERLRRHDSR